MICDICKERPAIYGDALTWNHCAKCEAEFRAKEGKEEPIQQDSVGFPHQIVPGLTSIIIPIYMANYQLFHLTGDCIGSVREHTPSGEYEIIIVDNGSPIQPPNLQAYYAEKVINNKENFGFTKAVNQGIRASFGEYIVLLSNDTKVYNGWLIGLRKALDNGLDLAMSHPMYSLTEPFARAIESGEVVMGEKKFDPIPGGRDFSCVAFKKSLIDEIGLFDERFINYCSDSDFLKKMELTGKKYGMVDEVAIHHISDATGYAIGVGESMNEDKKRFEEKWLTGEEPTQMAEVSYVMVDRGDGPRCAWCDQLNPTEEHLQEHDKPHLVRTEATGDAIFLIKDDQIHHIKNPDTLHALGFDFGQDKLITRADFKTYQKGEPIDMNNVGKYAKV